jgi:hypothetical protein
MEKTDERRNKERKEKKNPKGMTKQIVAANLIGGIAEPLRHLPSPSAAAVN